MYFCTEVSELGGLQALGLLSYPDVTRAKAVTLLPVTCLYVTNVAFALVSLGSLNIVFYRQAIVVCIVTSHAARPVPATAILFPCSSLKRLTPMIILVIKVRQGHVKAVSYERRQHEHAMINDPVNAVDHEQDTTPASDCLLGGNGGWRLHHCRHWGLCI